MPNRVLGLTAYVNRLKSITGDQAVREIGQALYVAGNAIQVEAQTSITRGAISGAHHVPSRPGSPPLRDTGNLDGKIETVQVAPLKVEVSSNADYSAALEFGSSKVAARPFMRPAAEHKKDEVQRLVQGAVDRVIARTGGGGTPTQE